MRAPQPTSSVSTENRLLAGLPKRERAHVMASARLVKLAANTVLVDKDQELRFIYFPIDCTISIFSPAETTVPMAVSVIGSEGMLGGITLLGSGLFPGPAVVLSAGTAWRVSRKSLMTITTESAAIRRRLFLYLHLSIIGLAQQAVCGHFHSIESRLARWLLMIHDRVGCDQFDLTHQTLADLLGVRRVGVSIAASALQTRDLIDYRRGVMRLIDRKGLQAAACDCYGISEGHYKKMLG